MTFNDLKLIKSAEPFADVSRARHDFPNGYGVSVIIGRFSYGGDEGKYELAVFHDGCLCYNTPITDDVIGYLEPDEVTALLARIEALPENKLCSHRH